MIDDNTVSVQSEMTRYTYAYSYYFIYSVKNLSLLLSYFNSCFTLGMAYLVHNNQVHPGQCPLPLLKPKSLSPTTPEEKMTLPSFLSHKKIFSFSLLKDQYCPSSVIRRGGQENDDCLWYFFSQITY